MSLEAARALAGQLAAESDDDFVGAGFETVLCRKPDEAELAECRMTLSRLREALDGRADAASRARSALIHALFNHNDFVTIR